MQELFIPRATSRWNCLVPRPMNLTRKRKCVSQWENAITKKAHGTTYFLYFWLQISHIGQTNVRKRLAMR